MICLTCDVHHMTLRTRDQQCLADRSEGSIALEFVQQCVAEGIRLTCFLTGRFIVDELPTARAIGDFGEVEIGGHTWSAFQPELLHRVSNKLLGTFNGPAWYQSRDIRKTVEAARKHLGVELRTWRNHAYINDRNTETLLSRHGIRILTDGTSVDIHSPERAPSGIYRFPINVIPDHEHLYHGRRTRDYVEQWKARTGFCDAFSADSYAFDEWFERFRAQVIANEKDERITLALIHPICIYLAGGDEAMNKVVDFLAGFESCQLIETLG